ncbi:MAG: antitoxin [Proteobacteria bacterium]|jgi:hypothetical protein|nr:antitoxin [Pseudomonadota bacterium]
MSFPVGRQNDILIHMTMTKRIQIPIDEPELALVKAAATRAGLAVAEWARRILREEARREIGGVDLCPKRALGLLFEADAPISDLETMLEESVEGRLR